MHEREGLGDAHPQMGPAMAAAALADAEEAQTLASHAVAVGSGWTSRSLGAYGLASAVFLVLTGTLPGVGGAIAYISSWVAYAVISRWFARHERVSWRGFDRLSGRSFAAWFVLQGAGCAVGFNFFAGDAAYWVPVALVVSAPLIAGAWRAAHR